MASNKGKFVNTFSSMQMLGDYDEESYENEPDEVEKIFSPTENNLIFSPPMSTENNLNQQTLISPIIEPSQVSNEEAIVSNGDDLYNPLEDMDVASDHEDNNMELSTSPPYVEPHKNEPPTNNNFNDTHFEIEHSEIEENQKSSEDIIFPDVDMNKELSDISSQEEDGEEVLNTKESNKDSINEELQETTKANELSSNNLDFIDDEDELLGTALAELEQEEKEKEEQLELEKLMSLEKLSTTEKKTKKKKKKTKSKDKGLKNDEKDSKKRRKRKEKKKKKAKEKDPDAIKKKRKSKEKKEKESEIGIDELLDRIREEEQKEHAKKHENKKSKGSKPLKKDGHESLTKEKKNSESREKSKERKSGEHKNNSSPTIERRHDSKDSRKRSPSIERRRDSKDIRKRSPSFERRRNSKDIRKRSPSVDRKRDSKNDHKRSPSVEKRRDSKVDRKRISPVERRHDSKNDRKRSISIEKRQDSKDSKEHTSRKRISKDSAPEHVNNKRAREDVSPVEDQPRRSRKSLDVAKDHNRKKSHRNDSSEERELRRKHRTADRKISEREQKVIPEKSRLDYEIKVPERTRGPGSKTPPKLSKEEFYQLQHNVRKFDAKPIQRASKESSESSSSESDVEVEKALHRSSFNENYSSELDKFRNIHKVEITERNKNSTLDTSNDISYNKRKENVRRDSENKSTSRHKSHSPNDNLHKTDNEHDHSRIKRRHSISETNDSLHVNVSEDLSATKQFHNISEDNISLDIHVPVDDSQTSDNESIKISSYHTSIFGSKPNHENHESFRHTESISSVSDTEGSLEMTGEKQLKPGSLSLRQYKERRNSGKKRNHEHHSSERHRRTSEVVVYEKDDTVSRIEEFSRENKENLPHTVEISPEEKSNHIDDFNDEVESELKLHNGRQSIPLLFDGAIDEKPQNSSQSLGSDTDIFTVGKGDESPYNPEAASPLDMASPGVAAIEDRDDVDFSAYKDVIAYEDIMKSKVRHEARKHKRRKLEELKAEFGSPEADSKEEKLVDYLVRQAQVEEEMKNVLKPYFKSREITKDEYKDILKKAVPQVTMSNSPIIAEKIHSLMTKFVRKCKGHRAKEDKQRGKEQKQLAEQQKQLQLQLQTSAAMFQQIRVLNPNLPMPPM